MVKKRVGGGKRYKAAAAATKNAPDSADVPAGSKIGPAPPKHLQRKIARKVGFLDKVASSSKALAVQAGVTKKSGRKKGPSALHTLSTLSGVLDEVQQDVHRAAAASSQTKTKSKAKHTFGQGVRSGKLRSAIQVTETARLQQVLQHPVFLKNPIAAITNHLKSTLPVSEAGSKGKQAVKGQGRPGGKAGPQGGRPGQGVQGGRAEIKRLARQRKREQAVEDMEDD